MHRKYFTQNKEICTLNWAYVEGPMSSSDASDAHQQLRIDEVVDLRVGSLVYVDSVVVPNLLLVRITGNSAFSWDADKSPHRKIRDYVEIQYEVLDPLYFSHTGTKIVAANAPLPKIYREGVPQKDPVQESCSLR